jgi:hypothetical protein
MRLQISSGDAIETHICRNVARVNPPPIRLTN